MPPITIDNLGPGPSERYAKDQETLQEGAALIKGSQRMPATEILVTSPAPSDAENLLGLSGKALGIAIFRAPALFLTHSKAGTRVFTEELIPSLRIDDKKEELSRKLSAQIERRLSSAATLGKKEQYEKSRSQEKDEREKKILDKLLDQLDHCNKMLRQAYNGRVQFVKE